MLNSLQKLCLLILKMTGTLLLLFSLIGCGNDALLPPTNTVGFAPRLSEVGIFQGKIDDLVPTNRFAYYTLPAMLFTDNAEKQRLIALPEGKRLTVTGDDLPDFPDETMLVKTFYYFLDKRDTAKGKRILETRLLVKHEGIWNVATYRWNKEQTDANLITSGFDTNVEWTDIAGNKQSLVYHIPNNRECATCHQSRGTIHPIGPKMRNLNTDVMRGGAWVRQLEWLHEKNIFADIEMRRVGSVPRIQDASISLEQRARAYLDINCAHCHHTSGYASGEGLFLGYATPLAETNITTRKADILAQLRFGGMPLLGTKRTDEAGLRLLTQYFETLP